MWRSSTELDAQLSVVRQKSARVGTTPDIEALVQVVQETEDRPQALAGLDRQLSQTSPNDLADTPSVLVGTIEERAEQFLRQSQQPRISRCVVREPALEPVERIMSLLKWHPRRACRHRAKLSQNTCGHA